MKKVGAGNALRMLFGLMLTTGGVFSSCYLAYSGARTGDGIGFVLSLSLAVVFAALLLGCLMSMAEWYESVETPSA